MSFAATLEDFTSSTKKKVENTRKSATVETLGRIIGGTPVGDPSLWNPPRWPKGYKPGRLRGNWQTAIGSPDTENDGPKDKSGASTTLRMEKVVESSNPEDTIYFTNMVPYAYKVEMGGHSKQAPRGMMDLGTMSFSRIVRKHARAK